ncbi:MAG TPA: SDR family oxidoreductase [Acidothermaceae bacterium]|nr:SDR family oxidoreductase [Acidothermaceae bacterium]
MGDDVIADSADRFSLARRVAVVTGGAGLYGRHIADALARAGAHVVLAARDVAACERVAQTLRDSGLRASAHALDLGSEESIVALREALVDEVGRVDVLVNNAVFRQGRDPANTTADDWRATSAVNSTGLFLITREIGAVMVEQRSGVIVNVASMYGMVGPDFSLYRGTNMTMPAFYAYDKGGMINYTRYLATYYAPYGIRVNCVSPGGLGTDDQPAEFVQSYRDRVPLGRLATPDDIKGPILFLCSDASAYVTGVNLPVDGGWTAR